MQMDINFETTIKKLRADFAHLSADKFAAAIARSLNRTASSAKTLASREIRKTHKIPARELSKTITIRKASGRDDRLQADVQAEGKPLPAMAFGARQTRKGVTIDVKGSRKLLPGMFILTMKSGHKGVFARVQTEGTYKDGELLGRRKRVNKTGSDLPIGEVKSVGVPRAFSNAAVIKALEAKSHETFPPTLLHELKWRSEQA